VTLKQPKSIFVTQPHLPPLEEFIPYLEQIWDNKILTNSGPIHQQFEQAICDYLGVKYCSLVGNGTMALIVALRALQITGEVITTPYSFVATAHSLLWNGNRPIFCDIDPLTLNIDTNKIESLITPETTAILPVHVYGTPCDDHELQRIADIYDLKIIYDAAHSFGVKKDGISVCNYGDASILSFHATKVFHTFEGGAIITNNPELKKRIDNIRNFGYKDEVTVADNGINAKMSEIHAAMGMMMLNEYDSIVAERKEVVKKYDEALNGISGISRYLPSPIENRNYAYYPIFVDKNKYGISRDELYQRLKEKGIYTRRYFYPLISNMSTYCSFDSAIVSKLPIANKASESVLCLPLYGKLKTSDQVRITDTVRRKR